MTDTDDYLAGFMGGFEFVLLAIEGRLSEARLDAATEAKVRAFVTDYQRVLDTYREKRATESRTNPVPLIAAVLDARRN